MADFTGLCIPQTESLQMNSQVSAPYRVFSSEGTSKVTNTNSHPTTRCLLGARSAHVAEPAGPTIRISITGDFAAAGSDSQAATSLSAGFHDRRVAPVIGVRPLQVFGGRLIRP
jgi:hypothetical protein